MNSAKYTLHKHQLKRNIRAVSTIFLACAMAALVITGCGGKVETPVYWPVNYSPKISDFPESTVAPHPHIKSVRLILDSYIPVLEGKIRDSLEMERGVGQINVIPERRIVEVFPKGDKSYLNLYDVRAKVDSVHDVNVTRMDVFVVGKIEPFMVSHDDVGPDPYEHKRYRVTVGDQPSHVFMLADNDRLEEITQYNLAILVGQVSAFDDNVPILEITDYAPVKGTL